MKGSTIAMVSAVVAAAATYIAVDTVKEWRKEREQRLKEEAKAKEIIKQVHFFNIAHVRMQPANNI
jgi:uncharacterized protein YtpQ (UPF0354 family)